VTAINTIITSRDNPNVKLLAGLLARKKDRDEAGLFVAEGLRLCLDALRSGVKIRVLYITERAYERYPECVRLQETAEKMFWLSEDLADRISDATSSQGIFMVTEQLDNSQSAVTMKSGGHYLLLDGIRDPGNLGTILRSADALGVDGVLLSDCCDLYAPKVIRGSMGGLFRLPVAVTPDLGPSVKSLRDLGVPVYAAALEDNALEAGKVDFSGGAAILIGNEANGLSPELIRLCTASLIIPMAEGANSLNAAMAAVILLWEMKRPARD
jgi:TrmH family RNA methyltransferase